MVAAEPLPAGLTFVSAAASQGRSDGATGLWAVGTVAAGAAPALRGRARVDGPGPHANVATVEHADQFDPVAANDTAAAAAPRRADVGVTKPVARARPPVGADVALTLVVTNRGPDPAADAVLSAPLPPGVSFASAAASQGAYDPATGVWAGGTLPAGGTATLRITGRVTTAGTVTNTATVPESGTDPGLSSNRAAVTLAVPAPPADVSKRQFLASTPAAPAPAIDLAAGPLPPPNPGSRAMIAVGAEAGDVPLVRVFDRYTGQRRFSSYAYDRDFRGGVSVAVGDVTGDGPGGPEVAVSDGRSAARVLGFFAYDLAFHGGVTVTTGDVGGDGRTDIVTGAGPVVGVFGGATGRPLGRCLAMDAGFPGGLRVAATDADRDGRADVVVAAGPVGAAGVRPGRADREGGGRLLRVQPDIPRRGGRRGGGEVIHRRDGAVAVTPGHRRAAGQGHVTGCVGHTLGEPWDRPPGPGRARFFGGAGGSGLTGAGPGVTMRSAAGSGWWSPRRVFRGEGAAMIRFRRPAPVRGRGLRVRLLPGVAARAVWAAALMLAPCADATARAAAPPGRPNVVFIMADDLGWTDLGCQGSRYYETPNIDRLAEDGMRFTSAYTAGPNCQPTRAALMSGQYGPRTGVYTVGATTRFDTSKRPLVPVGNVQELPPDRRTLGDALTAAGYRTALFGKWHLGQQGKAHPAQRGFDEAVTSMGRHFDFATQPKVDYPKGTYLADWLTDRSVAFIAANKDRPFFLCLHHFGVHSPFEAKANLIEHFKPKPPAGGHRDPTYAAMIASVDESVGRVLAKLDELKLSDNTLVIFTSDNGGVGGYAAAGVKAGGITDNAPLRGGKGMLYEGGVRVPWVARWPGRVKPGTTCDEPVISVDLYPTLLDLAGAKPAAGTQVLDGTSITPLLFTGAAAQARKPLYWHFPGYLGGGKDDWRTTPAGAIRAGDWKLLEFFETGKVELYNLKDDVGQKTDLAAKMPGRAKELHAMLVEWRKAVNAPMPKKR